MALYQYPTLEATASIAGGATEAKQDTMILQLTDVNTELDAQSLLLTSLDGKDFATETTLALLNAKDFATETTLALLNAKDFATETTLAAVETDTQNISDKIDLLEARLAGNLVPETFDYLELTYVTVGNGIGEIETVIYKTGGSGGSTVATLTLGYDANDNLSTVTRS